MKREAIFWDVDTQFDFMKREGRLYLPGAEEIIEKVSEVRRFGLENGFSIVADIDWHSPSDKEISETPDFKETFPPHCMAGEQGVERIGYLGEIPIEYVQVGAMGEGKLRELVDKDQFHVVIRKESIDVFANPNTDKLLGLIKPKAVAVFGVALDYCVYYVLQGLAKYRDIKAYLLMDVVRGLQTRPDEEIFDELRQMGVEIIEFSDFKRRFQCGL